MAANRLGTEVSFQAAESMIDQIKNNQAALAAAFVAGLDPNAPLHQEDYDAFNGDTSLSVSMTIRYAGEVTALGNDIVIGSSGLRSLHFDLLSEVRRDVDTDITEDNSIFDTVHRQGIKRFAPRLP